MMLTKPHPNTALFSVVMIMSIIMALSSSNWMTMWMSMEINMLAILPLMLVSPLNSKTEAAIKYFLIQSMSSSAFLMSISLMYTFQNLSLINLIFLITILMKMGAAPAHFWMPPVISNMTWPLTFTILTIQKLPPMFIMSHIMNLWSPFTMTLIIALNLFMGSLGGLSQTYLRPLLTYSSISHMGWMMAATLVSKPLLSLYFMIYTLINFMIMIQLTSNKSSLTMNLSSTHNPHKLSSTLMLNILSLAGLPPLLGFIPKLMTILYLSSNHFMISGLLILSSAISLVFYLSLFLNFALSSPSFTPQLPSMSEFTISVLIPSLSIMYLIS